MTYITSRKTAAIGAAAIPLGAALLMAAQPAFAADAAVADAGPNVVSELAVQGGRTLKPVLSESAKATAALIDTPRTVNVINQELIRQQGATTLTEALQNSAGVGTFNLGENGSTNTGDAVYLRGSDISGSIFLDGVRDIASVYRDVFNVEQVEVLKGAAGVEIGRGAATGAVNLYTKQPTLRDVSSASLGFGSADYKRATVDVNTGIGRHAGFRLNVMTQDSNVAGRDAIKNSRWGIAPSFAIGLDRQTRVFIDYLHVTQNNTPDGGVFTIGLNGYRTPDAARPFLSAAPRVASTNFYGTKDDHDAVKIDTGTVIVEHEFSPDLTIRNLSRVSRTTEDYQLTSFTGAAAGLLTPNVNDRSTWTITPNINNKDQRNDVYSNQTNVRANVRTGPVYNTLSAGLELIREQQRNGTFTATGAYPPLRVYAPTPNVTGYLRTRTGHNDGRTDTVGLYFNDTLKLTEAFRLTGGVRLDHYDTRYSTVSPTTTANFGARGDLVSGMAGVVWKPKANGSVYASYAVTRQPPGGANFALTAANTANANNPNVAPQSATTYEVGTKWDLLKEMLAVTGAVYRTEYSDQILQDTDGTYYRTGKKSIDGIELSAQGQITRAWQISAGYTTMNTRVQSPTNQVVTADGSAVLAYNPSDSFSLWSTYRIDRRISVGGGARYNGPMKRGSDGAVGTPTQVDGYWVLNAFASVRVSRRADLQFNVYNLADARYVASINKSGYRYVPGAPRTARVTLNVSF